MALTKQSVPVNFSQGLDTKTDPFQVQVGKFLALNNAVFTKGGALTKRNGFANLTTLPTTAQTNLTTLNDNLIATGDSLYSYNADVDSWTNRGITQPVTLSTMPVSRSSMNQTAPDATVAANGLMCITYISNGVTYYKILDSATGGTVVTDTSILSIDTGITAVYSARVVYFNNYFVICYIGTVSASPHIRLIAIPTANPTAAPTVLNVSSVVASTTAGFDIVANSTNLYVLWGATGSSVQMTVATNSLSFSTPTTVSSTHGATLATIVIDTTTAPIIWAVYYDSGTTLGWTTAYNQLLTSVIQAEHILISGDTVVALTGTSQNSTITLFYEVMHAYTTTTTIRSDFTNTSIFTVGASSPTITTILRSVGLASKAFLSNNTSYVLAAFSTANQPSYFLIDAVGNVYARLAYSNGGGYVTTQTLPSVSLYNNQYYIAYLYQDFLTTVNKGTNLPSGTPSNSIYTQTGVNAVILSINQSNQPQYSSEIADSLHLTGGQLWQYDGVMPVEHGFQVWPEPIEGAWSVTPATPTGVWASGSTSIVVSSTTGIGIGMTVTDTTNPSYIPSGTTVVSISGLTVTISAATTDAAIGDALSFVGNMAAIPVSGGSNTNAYFYQFTYEWTDGAGMLHRSAPSIPLAITTTGSGSAGSVTLYIPTLCLTYKVGNNPVRVVGYRWSQGQQEYYQFTSVVYPVINNTIHDFVTIVDGLADSSILGNTLLYTTGGVVENIAAPASIASCLFKSRLFLVDAEDQNLLWYSKQVIEAVPVEMSDLFTLYVAPTTGAQGSTGPITALSAMDDKLIIFKKDAIYYLTGTGPDNTGASNDFSDPIYVTGSVGCSNPSSIVLMPQGLMFQSDKGIWLLGRDLSTNYIGAPVESFNSQTVESAQTIPATNQVRFLLNGTTLMYDYYYNQWGTFNNIYAISSTLYQGYQTYLNKYGQVFQESPGTYLDGTSPVLMGLTTSWMNVAGIRGYERFYYFLMLGTYYTPFKLNVQLAYDYGFPEYAIQVTPDNQTPNWGGDAQWGSGTAWGGIGNAFQARVFPNKQKCQTFQVSITEQYDSSYGQPAGQGLSLSGFNFVIGVKKSYSPQIARRSFG